MRTIVALVTLLLFYGSLAIYEPTWESLDARPLPSWYDEAKIGIFMHWGVFSVPSFDSEWFWHNWQTASPGAPIRKFMEENYRPDFTYGDFGPMFTAELYNPDHWADVFAASGAKYTVLTSKHHEGFCNWNTSVSFNWNSMDVGPKRDLVGDLAKSIKNRTDLHFGLYHSLFEWYNPIYLQDKANSWKTQHFSLGKAIPELHELVNQYHPEIIWSDGEWEAPDTYWNATEFLAWLYNESPVKDTVVVNDRWGFLTMCRHGGYWTCQDKYNPGVLQKKKWENAMTIDSGSWGYRRNTDLSAYLTSTDLVKLLAETISCGGNLLMNIGPTHDGRILPVFEERLRQLGVWLKVNGEAVYGSKPWTYQNDTVTPGVWYTQQKSNSSVTGYSVYAFMLDWPDSDQLELSSPVPSQDTIVSMLGQGQLKYKQAGTKIVVSLPFISPKKILPTAGTTEHKQAATTLIISLPSISPKKIGQLEEQFQLLVVPC